MPTGGSRLEPQAAAGKCVAAGRRPDLRWRRRGTVHPLYQEGGARDVR